MWSISRCKTYKKISGNAYVPFRGPFQEFLPVSSRNAVETLPSAHPFFGNIQIRSERFPPPRSNDLSVALHARHYGEVLHFCQGETLQCILWINPPHYSS
ncbi:hypothetical protein LCGC14_2221830 [marine sediment metagenome]|uniref:Uncharacterized protein n=1 Tax=marine sediment metagenome TaxID=412755 RepID=A0A0F9DYC8_9ZZZZ